MRYQRISCGIIFLMSDMRHFPNNFFFFCKTSIVHSRFRYNNESKGFPTNYRMLLGKKLQKCKYPYSIHTTTNRIPKKEETLLPPHYQLNSWYVNPHTFIASNLKHVWTFTHTYQIGNLQIPTKNVSSFSNYSEECNNLSNYFCLS